MPEQANLDADRFKPWESNGEIRYGDDPTKQILGKSDLNMPC